MTTYKDYLRIKGFDVSQWNDNQETVYVPDFDALIARGFKFVGIRTSYGIVKDKDFDAFWGEAKGKLIRVPYHFLYYYCYVQLKISPAEWGRRQARFVWSLLKDDPGEASKLCKKYKRVILLLDVENSGCAAAITEDNKSTVGVIINAFFPEFDTLSNSTSGIYTNQGYLFVFGASHKTRPLWFSWYNRKVTIERIREVLAAWHYTGEFIILQYTSDGDIDDDGISDARALGMESSSLDLNVWLGDPADLEDATTETKPPAYETPNETPQPVTKTVTIVTPQGLKVREGPGQSYETISALACGVSRDLIAEKTDVAGNQWEEVAEGWICSRFGSSVLAKVSIK